MTRTPDTRLDDLKAVLRSAAIDITETADVLQFLSGLAKRVPDAVPHEELDRLNDVVIQLISHQAALDAAASRLLNATRSGPRGTYAQAAIAAFLEYMNNLEVDTRRAHGRPQ